MKVESLEIRNFKAIEHEKIAIDGNNVYVLGPNAVGKSSFIDAIFKILSGKYPDKPTKQNEERGMVKLDLGEVIVIATFNEKNEKVNLTIEDKEGNQFKSPRGMLDSMVGIVDFNINEFFNMRPKEKVDFLKQLCGIDFTDLDEQYKEAYDNRTFVNRKLKDQEARSNVFFDKKKVHKKDKEDIAAKFQEISKHNESISKVESGINNRKKDIARLDGEIEVLKAQLKEKEEASTKFKKEIADGEKWLSTRERKDASSIETELAEIDKYNQEVEDNLRNKEELDKLEILIKQQEEADKKVKDIEETKRRVIEEAKLPVEGLTFNDTNVFYNGLPFEESQINTAQQIIIGLQLNEVLLKDVRIARFEGSLLDHNNLKQVSDWAAKHDLQLFVEFVEPSGEGMKINIVEKKKGDGF